MSQVCHSVHLSHARDNILLQNYSSKQNIICVNTSLLYTKEMRPYSREKYDKSSYYTFLVLEPNNNI